MSFLASKAVDSLRRGATCFLVGLAVFSTAIDSFAQGQAAPKEPRLIQLVLGRSATVELTWPAKGVSITEPGIGDVQVLSPQLLLFSGRAPGSTDALAWGENGQSMAFQVEVVADISKIKSDLSSLMEGSDLTVTQTQKAMIVQGRLARAEQANHLRAYMDALGLKYVDLTYLPGVQQVQVKVRFAEVSRTAFRSLGVNAFRTGSDFFFGSNIGGLASTSIGPPQGATALGNTPFVFTQASTVSPAVTLFAGFPRSDLELFFQALAENQFLRILSEPNLVALSGEEASFLAGGEFPIPSVQGGGGAGLATGNAVTIEFKEFGVGLRFRPVVLGDGTIRLQVNSEVSELSDVGGIQISGFQIPSIITRRASTTLEMSSGQTFAMAGLLSENVNSQASRVPFLGSLPLIGTLFRSVRYRAGETELLVLVSASLVEPLSQITMPTMPGKEQQVPSDWQLYGEGRLEGGSHPSEAGSSGNWVQSQGFNQLRGPGAWAVHDHGPARSEARTAKSDRAPAPGNSKEN